MKKTALITGGSRGIGAACVQALGHAGYNIALHYRSEPELAQNVLKEIPEGEAFQYDLGENGACQALVKEVKEKFGRIDVLINNAGMVIDKILPFAKPNDFSTLLDVNMKPVFLLAKFCSKIMIRQKSGSIISITSVVGHSGNSGQSMYAATKSGITGFTKSIAHELAAYGIRANCVAPGFIKTDMTKDLTDQVQEEILKKIPLKRLGLASEVAQAAKFLASDEASYITGSTIHVNGGMYTS